MNTTWSDDIERTVTSPMTLNISAFSNAEDLRVGVTPELSDAESTLLHVWINQGNFRMGEAVYTKATIFMVGQHLI